MTLELILVLPILFIALLAIVEFGLVMANLKQVALASREGARLAAEAPSLNLATAAMIRAELDQRLESAGFGAAATQGVKLQQSVLAGGPFIDGTCAVPDVALPPASVRITVCVPLQSLTPNLLQAFGFDISGTVVEHSTIMRYEL